MPEIDTPAEPAKLKSPRHKKLLTDEQHKHAAHCYLKLRLAPRLVAYELNKKFLTNFTSQQISDYARSGKHNWAARRRKLGELVVEPQAHEIVKAAKSELVSQHQPFLDQTARVAQKAMNKAESIIERAADARTLSSAVAAAKSSAEMYRKSVGLDDEHSPRNGAHVYNFNFAKGPGSPFAAQVVAAPVIEAEVERIEPPTEQTDDDDGDDANDEGIDLALAG